ncbi:MAG: transglutaminase-like cysteine peptidase [Pseudomonadota bacterium]
MLTPQILARAAVAPQSSSPVNQWILLLPLSFLLLLLMATSEPHAAESVLHNAVQNEGAPHRGPRAYHAMCARAPSLCQHDRQAGRTQGMGAAATLTPERWAQLVEANDAINFAMRPGEDLALHGQSDFWTDGGAAGDCEDFAISKKQLLIGQGWSADQLLYAVVEGIDTPYHAVLIARTDKGDFVLDNLSPGVKRWDQSGYRFIIRQSAANPHAWVYVDPTPPANSDPLRVAER